MQQENTPKKKYNIVAIIISVLVVLTCGLVPTATKVPSIKFHYEDDSLKGTAQIFWTVGEESFNETESVKREIAEGQISFNVPETISSFRFDFINEIKVFGIEGISFCFGDKASKTFSGEELLECIDEWYGISDMDVEGDVVYIHPSNEDPYIYASEEFVEAYNNSSKKVLTVYNLLYAVIAAMVCYIVFNFKKFIGDFAEAFKYLKETYKEKGIKTRHGILSLIILIIALITTIACLCSFVVFEGADSTRDYSDIWKIVLIFVVSLLAVNIIPALPAGYNNVLRWIIVALPYFNFFSVEKIIDGTVQTDETIVKIGLLIVYTIYIFLCGFFNNYSIGYALSTVFMIVFALTDYFVIEFRGRAIIVTDVYAARTAADVANAYEYSISANAFVYVLLMICGSIAMFAFRFPKVKLPVYFIRVAITVALSVMMIKGVNGSIVHHGITMNYWTIDESFEDNGYILGFYISIGDMTIEQPEGYSADIIETYVEEEAQAVEGVQPTNLIIIMNESWTDLSYLGDLETNIPYMDYYNSMSGNVVKGKLHVPVYSSGTSCSEYEVLTGNAVRFLPQGLSPYEAYSSQNEYSLATTAKMQGYTTIAMHPENPKNWNRNNVYPYMGFDDFYSIEDYNDYDRVRSYVGDRGNFEKIIHYLEDKSPGEKTFIFNVTMQNHGGYTGEYENFEVDVTTTNTKENYERVNNYLSLVKLTDESLQYLIEYLEDYEENTMVVMFGDHYPGIEERFYNEIMKADEGISWEKAEERYATPYFIWTNYDVELEEIGDISSNYLGSYVMKMANLKTTEYNDFLIETSKELPILGIYGMYNKEGQYCTYDDERYQEILDKYWHIQYNYIFDKQNRNDAIFTIQ